MFYKQPNNTRKPPEIPKIRKIFDIKSHIIRKLYKLDKNLNIKRRRKIEKN